MKYIIQLSGNKVVFFQAPVPEGELELSEGYQVWEGEFPELGENQRYILDGDEIKTEAVYTDVELARRQKRNDIKTYDTSDAVNSFTYEGIEMWVGREDRLAIINGILAEKALGETTTKITLPSGVQVELNIDTALDFLYKIESYAKACYNNTAAHLIAIEALTTQQEVEDYDHKENYPDKLTFNTRKS